MTDAVIKAENLGKSYRIGREQPSYLTLRESIADLVTAPYRKIKSLVTGYAAAEYGETIWALEDVSFEISRGEIVGIIGRNGAGKSTLLKILCGITEPSRGNAEVRGRIGSLLEVGAGFHPELTGRENIYLNGAILGMKRAEINNKFDEILEFSEVGRFVDTPVKHYSSGMYMRLAFSVAAHLDTEILLVDEVLAVGDLNFQHKCIQKMDDVSRQGQTVLVVSHNIRLIETLTSRCLYLNSGKLKCLDQTCNIISEYQRDVLTESTHADCPPELNVEIPNPSVDIGDLAFRDSADRITESFDPDAPVSLGCKVKSIEWQDNAVICMRICQNRMIISGNNSEHMLGRLEMKAGVSYNLRITFEGLWLIPGKYVAVIYVQPDYFSNIASCISGIRILEFVITGSRNYGGGLVSMKQKWVLE